MGCWGVRVRVGIGSTPSTTYTLRYQFSVNNINTDVSADACCCFGWCGENTPSHLSILNNAEVTGDTSSEALSIKVVQARSNGWRYHTFCDVARTRGARVAVFVYCKDTWITRDTSLKFETVFSLSFVKIDVHFLHVDLAFMLAFVSRLHTVDFLKAAARKPVIINEPWLGYTIHAVQIICFLRLISTLRKQKSIITITEVSYSEGLVSFLFQVKQMTSKIWTEK